MHEVISGHYKREMECLVMDIQRAGRRRSLLNAFK